MMQSKCNSVFGLQHQIVDAISFGSYDVHIGHVELALARGQHA